MKEDAKNKLKSIYSNEYSLFFMQRMRDLYILVNFQTWLFLEM